MRFLCWLLGHDLYLTGWHRSAWRCIRCGRGWYTTNGHTEAR